MICQPKSSADVEDTLGRNVCQDSEIMDNYKSPFYSFRGSAGEASSDNKT